MRVAGVSLEDSFLKISIVDKKFGFIKPVKSEEIKLPLSEQERLSVIKETFQKLKEKHKTDNVVIGLNLNNFSHHVIDMPSLARADMRNALLYELERYLPMPPEEYIYDFFIIEKVSRRTRILVFSIRKDLVDGILNAVRDSGLNLAAIRCSFIEAINEFITTGKIRDAIFVFATEDNYHIAGLKGQMPALFRTILKGKDIISEIEKLTESFSGGIYISGASEPVLLDKINAKTFPLSLPNAIALSVLRKQRFKFNFLPADFLPEKKDYYPYAIGALTSLAVILFFFTGLYSYYKDYSALSSVEKKIAQIKERASGLLDARKKLESIHEKRKFLHDFQGKRNLNIKVLTELSRIMPKDAWLTGMSVDEKGRVEIEGFANRAANIIEPLNKSKLFKKVEFAAPIVSQDGKERFSIRMEIAA